MGVNKTVFGSSAERKNFEKLESRWGERFSLYHNIPFLNIFSRTPLINSDDRDWRPLMISDIDWQRLKKTSVDYVLCEKVSGKPLVCIEFDGLQDGFNVGREYRAGVEHPSPWRNQITTLKLKVAHGSLFPFFVVASKHFADISPAVRWSIVDGIIGEVLAKNATSERFLRGFEPTDVGLTQAEWEALPPWDQDPIVEDWAIGVEVSNECEHNPMYFEIEKLNTELRFPKATHRFFGGGPLGDEPFFGAECVLNTNDVGTVTRIASMPNFKAPGFMGLGLVESIAHLMALDEVRRRRARLS